MGLPADLAGTFVLGLLTPLTSVCVIPLYPGFLAYLAHAGDEQVSVGALGVAVASGVIAFMLVVGLLFATLLEVSLTRVIEVLSPAAFGVLGLGSVLLILDFDLTKRIPTYEPPASRHPVVGAFAYGSFFGAIVLPCNPAFIALFFARSFLFTSPVANLLNFLAFGLGIGFPLFALAVVSDRWSRRVIGTITTHRSLVNRGSGVVMLVVSIYYLVVVFDVIGIT